MRAKRKASNVLASACTMCGKALALHFDARGRKLDCAQAPTLANALADARHKANVLARYITRLESLA